MLSRVHPFRSFVADNFLGPLRGRLADHNPFYLISAACMLGGCLGVTNSLSWVSIPLPRLLVLIATINAYEATLIGLALLLGRRGLWRDNRILLLLEAFFLVDVAFVNAEIITNNLALGIAINVALLAFAGVKLHFINLAIGGVALAKRIFVMVQLVVLAALPGVLRNIDHNGSVSGMDFFVLWWVIGLLPVAYEIIARLCPSRQTATPTLLGDVYTALPWISLIGHLGIMHYVYGVDYFGAMAAPVLLGFSLVLNRLHPSLLATRRQLLTLRIMLPLAAVLVSLNDPHVLSLVLGWHGLLLTPSRLAMSAAYLLYVYTFALRHAVVLVPAGIMAALLWVLGPTAEQWSTLGANTWQNVQRGVDSATPKTAAQWGTLSVIAAFIFLAIGAWVSLGHHPKVESLPDEVK